MNSRKNPARLFKNVKPTSYDRPVVATEITRNMSLRTVAGTVLHVFDVAPSIRDDGKVRIKFTNDTFTGTTFDASHVFYVAE